MQKTGKVRLPQGSTIALNLGFDFDSSSVWMESFGKTSPVYTSRGEYGAEVGVPRILNLLDKYHIKANFFVPGHSADTYPDVCREISAGGHEICHHGYVHEDPTELSYHEEENIIVKGLEALDRIGITPQGYRSPGFDFSPNTVELLQKYGFKYDSSLMGNDFYPYCPAPCIVHFDRGNEFGEPADIVEMPVSWYMDDFPHSEFVMTRTGMKPQSQVFEIWKSTLDYGADNIKDGVLNVTMHPQVIGRPHNIRMLEDFIIHAVSRGAYITTMMDIYERTEF